MDQASSRRPSGSGVFQKNPNVVRYIDIERLQGFFLFL
jgi:hypothetical protein